MAAIESLVVFVVYAVGPGIKLEDEVSEIERAVVDKELFAAAVYGASTIYD